MLDHVARECAVSGATVERIAGRMGFGDCVRATFSFGREPGPGILIMGHLDTVHPVGTLASCRGGARASAATAPASST